MVKGILLAFMLLSVSGPLWALNGARLINQSSSGQTALFNLGIHDGVKEGDYAVIVKEIRDLDSRDLRLIPIAKARNIKMNTQSSVWVLYKIFDSELLVKGDKYLILSESAMLSGRRDPRFGRLGVVTDKKKAGSAVKNALSDDKDRLSRLKTQYPEVAPIHEREVRSDRDGELIDVKEWRKFKGSKYASALYKSPYEKEFQRDLRLQTFEKLVTAYLRKVNEPGFNYDQFYDEQMKSEFANEFRKRMTMDNEYESFLSNQAQKAVADAKLYRSILEKGETWSEDFSDEELRVILNEVSVLQEKDRRDWVAARPNRYAVFLGGGVALNDPQTDEDQAGRRDNRYAMELDFEAIPLLKHDTLERFTLNATVRYNQGAFSADNYNAQLNETSFTLGMNWYPLYAPYAIEAPVIFLGAYIRSGWANATATSVDQKANYTVLSMPGVRAGFRYNFRNSVGLRIFASMESLSLDRYEQSELNTVLPDDTNIADGKFNFAVSYSF